MRTTTLQSSKATSRLWKLFAAMLLVWLLIPVGQVSAQISGSGTAKPCWVYTRPNGVPTLTLLKTETNLDQFNGYKLNGTTILDKSATTGDEIIEGEPFDQTTWYAYWNEKANITHQTATKVKKVIFDATFADVHPTSCANWFKSFSKLESIEGMQYFNTDLVTDMSHMFSECAILSEIDITHFNTYMVKDMSNMFHGCAKLTSLDFTKCKDFNTANVKDMTGMFANCHELATLEISNFNTSEVTSMNAMFMECSSLTNINVASFNTSKVTDMSYMFCCSSSSGLTQLTLQGFDVSNVKNTEGMFLGRSSLKSIYANDWSSKSITTSDWMFWGCTNLVGAVTFDASKLNGDMANGQTGYFMPRYTDGNGKVTYFEKNENNQIVLNLYNANPFVVSTAYNIDKGTYTRENMPSNWGTVCVPFIIDVTNAETNCEIYKFHTVEGENLYIEKVTEGEIAAGTPVIVKGTKGADLKVCSPKRNQAIVTAPVNGTETNHLEGTFAGQKLEGTSNYFIAKDKFWQVSGYDNEGNTIKGVNVPPFRATIMAKGSQAQSLGIVVIDGTNGIDLTPTIEDLLSEKAEYFDLQGRRLDGPQKGINLVRMGGKTRKVVIK